MSSWRSHGVLGRVNTHEAPERTRADLDVALRAAAGAVDLPRTHGICAAPQEVLTSHGCARKLRRETFAAALKDSLTR